MAAPKCFVSRWKVQRKLWTPENTRGAPLQGPAEAQPVFGLHASFEAARHAPLMGRPMALVRTTDTVRTRAANNPDVSACSRSEGKRQGSGEGGFAKARSGAGWNAVKAGVLPGKLTGPVNTRSTPSKPKDKGVRKEDLRRFGAIKPQLRPVCKAGHFCRSRENDGQQRPALKRRPPCGGRGCGCRAAWPCRRDCR